MSQAVEVRALVNQDVQEQAHALRELLLENARINFPDAEDPALMAESWFANLVRFISDGSAVALGAFEGGLLRGFAWAYRREVVDETRMHLGQIVVAEDARSRGIGQQLLQGVENAARIEGIATIELMTSLHNTAACRFYSANGFVAARVQMEKSLWPRERQ